jgi:hypothetical protein
MLCFEVRGQVGNEDVEVSSAAWKDKSKKEMFRMRKDIIISR